MQNHSYGQSGFVQNVLKTIFTGRMNFLNRSQNHSFKNEFVQNVRKPIFMSNVNLLAEQIYLQIVLETILKNITNLCANR